MAFAKDPKKVPELEYFLLKFTERIKIRKRKSMTKEEAAEKAKQHWLPWAGIKKKVKG